MPRTASSASKPSVALSPYRLNTLPSRNWTSPVAVALRVHRLLRRFGDRAHVATQPHSGSGQGSLTSPTQLTPSSPLHTTKNRGLKRTYSFLEPSFCPETTSHSNVGGNAGAAAVPEVMVVQGESPISGDGEAGALVLRYALLTLSCYIVR